MNLESAPPAGRTQILVAEDSAPDMVRLRVVLERSGYAVLAARSGAEALALLERGPALVITEAALPGLDGYALCRAIREGRWGRIRVILLTTLSDPGDIVRGIECGADNFIRKPFDEKYLLACVEHLLHDGNGETAPGASVENVANPRHVVALEREQILDLLISTYEQAVQVSRDLSAREKELGAATEVLDGLNGIAAGLNHAGSEREVLELALDRAVRLPNVRAGWILLREGDGELRLAASRNLPAALEKPEAFEGTCACTSRLLSGDLETTTNIMECERLRGAGAGGLRHHASVPLWVNDRALGVMNLVGPDEGLFGAEDLRTLFNIGNQVGVALDHARLRDRLDDLVEERTAILEAEIAGRARIEAEILVRARREAALAELGKIAMNASDLQTIFDEACRLVSEMLGTDIVAIVECVEDGSRLLVRAGTAGAGATPPEDPSQLRYVLAAEGPVVVTDYATEPRFTRSPLLAEKNIASCVSAPIRGGGAPFGVLSAFSTKQGGFAGGAEVFVGAVADLVAAALRRGRAEESLRESEERFRLLFDRMPYPAWVYDRETLAFLAVNDAAVTHYGYSREEFLGMTIKNIRPPEEVDRLLGRLSEIRGMPASTLPRTSGIFVHRLRDGSRIEVEIASSLISFSGRAAGLVIASDITERRRIEQQSFRAQRMESIGTLAGGIAHDLNNILMPIMMGVTLLKRANQTEATARAIENIEKSAFRGRDLVSQVLSFARGIEGVRVPVHIGELASELRGIIDSTFPKNISVTLDVPKDLWWIDADPTQVNQVLLNLCVNARDAMPAGGPLSISARNAKIDQQYAMMDKGLSAGPYVMIEVADEGAGMPKAIVDRIFEPFFTTKEIGRGTGLGLSTVAAIVKSHGGAVNVYSEPGRGSAFRVYFPAPGIGRETKAEPGPASLAALPAGNGETILIVDDEPSILAITGQTLESFGYRVLTALDGAQAMGAWALHRADIAVVLTDMMMPIMDGPALITALRRLDPDVRIIASSGLNEDRYEARAAKAGVEVFLQKPYTADVLLVTLRRVIDES